MNNILFSAIAILATVLYVFSIVLFFWLHFTKSQYKITTHALSDYGVGTTAKRFQLYAWTGTTGALALTALFYFSQQPKFPVVITICMLSMVVSRVGVSTFKTDLEGNPRTKEGIFHYIFAILTFAFAFTAIANATPVFIANGASFLSSTLGILQFVAMFSLAGVVVTLFKQLRQFFAITERIFLLSTLLWFLIASCLFIR